MNTLRSARARHALALLLTIVGLLSTAVAARAGVGSPTPRDLHIMTACRVYDSRLTGGPLSSGQVRDIDLPAGCGIPDDAISVIVNFTVVNPPTAGFIQVYQGGTTPPTSNALAFQAGEILGQLFVVRLGAGPDLQVRPTMGGGQTHFVIDVLAYNGSGAPSDIALDNTTVQENQPVGTLVGNLSTTDPDFDDTHTYSLVAGTGSTDNDKFQISGSQLQTNAVLDRKEQETYSIRVRSTDNFGVFSEEIFTITAGNENEPPVIVAGGVLNYTEGAAPTAIDAGLTVTDDSTNLQSATVQITGGFQSSEDVLSFVNTPNITAGAFDTGTGTLTLTGTDTVANWQTALRSVRYNNTSENPATAARTVTWIATDDGSLSSTPVTSTINVSSTNSQPTISVIGDQLINEDGSTGALAFTVGDAETLPASLIVTGLSSNTSIIPNANVVLGGSGASRTVMVTPAANANGGPVTITITVDDGSGAPNATASETFDVTVTAVNDEPTLDPIADPADILEDAGLQTINLTGIGAGGAGTESAQILTVTAVSDNPGLIPNPTVIYTSPNATGTLQYTPVANQSGTAIITVTVQDDGGIANGGDDTIQRTFTVDVLSVNGEPTLDPIPDPADINEDAGLQTVSLTGISAGDGGSESGQTLTVTALSSNPALIPHPTVIYTSPNATGSLQYTPVANQFGTAIITVTVQDNGGTANGGDDTIQRTFTVDVLSRNDEPTLDPIADPADINEDAGLQTVNLTGISAGGAGTESGQTLTVTAVSSNPGLIPNPTVVYTSPNATGSLTYTPVANQSGTAIITVTVQDNGGTANGGDDTIQRTFTVDVLASNDEPTLDPIADPADILEDAGLQTVGLTGIGAGGAGSESGQTLTVTALSSNPGLIPHPTVIYTSPNAAGSLQYTPVANQFGTAIITVTVQDNGGTANGGDDTIQRTFTVDVLAVNDEPTLDPIPDPADILEDAPQQTVNLTGISAGGGESQTLTVTAVSSNPGLIPHPTVVYTSPNATGSLQYTPVANQFGTAIITVTVQDNGGTANGGDDTIQRTFTVDVLPVNDPPLFVDATLDYTTAGNTQLRGGDLTPGASVAHVRDNLDLAEKSVPSDIDGPAPPFTFSLGVAPANGQATVHPDGTFTYEPNPGFHGPTDTFTVAVSDGGTLPNTSNITVTVTISQMVWYVHNVVAPANPDNPAGGDGRSTNAFDTITALNAATTNNGDIIFIFEGTTGTTPLTGAITLKDGQKLWGQGIALNVPGFGTPLVNATNKPRIRTTTASTDVVSVPATAGNRNNVEIRGLDLEATGATSNAIDVTASGGNIVGITISDDNIRGATAEGIDLNAGATAAFSATVQNNTITSAGTGIDTRASSTGTTTVTASSNMITSTAGNAFDARTIAGATAATALRVALNNGNVAAAGNGIVIDGSAAGTTTITGFANNAVDGSTGGIGISITSATFDSTAGAPYNLVTGGTAVVGAPGVGSGVGGAGIVMSNVAGDLAFTDLDVYAEGGAGIQITGTGAVNVGTATGTRFTVGAGVGIVEATSGPAVSLNNLTADLQLTTLKSTSTTTSGVSLTNVSDAVNPVFNAVFSAGSGSTITTTAAASGPVFNVSGGNAAITYPGTITNSGTGRAVSIATWSGDDTNDNITLSGAIDENGTGILVNGTGGTCNSDPDGCPITFSGGLDIDTTSGEGFAATSNGGSVRLHITGTNTIDSISATALRVTSTTIGNSNLNFQRISSGNNTAAADPANGIVLNATGTLGRLIVTGTGASGQGGNSTGGLIQNITGHGISLTDTTNPSFTNMSIQSTGGSGINGTLVASFTFDNGTITGSGDANQEANIAFNGSGSLTGNNVNGVVTITDSVLNTAFDSGIYIESDSGTISDLTVSTNSFTSTTSDATSKGDGVKVVVKGNATTVANLTRATIANNVIANFPSGAGIQVIGGNSNATGPGGSVGTPGSGTNVLSITGNRIAGPSAANRMGTSAIIVSINGGNSASRSQGNFDVSSNGTVANPLTNMDGTAILVGHNGYATGTYTMNNNVIVANNINASPGIGGGNGIVVSTAETPDLTWTMTGNNISSTDGNGILAVSRGVTGIMKVKIQNNTVAAPLTGVRPGIRVDAGNATSVDDAVCLNISGNTTGGSGGHEGIGLRKQGTAPTTNDFGIHGMAATSSPGVEQFVGNGPGGQNPGTANGSFGTNGVLLLSATSGFSSCVLP